MFTNGYGITTYYNHQKLCAVKTRPQRMIFSVVMADSLLWAMANGGHTKSVCFCGCVIEHSMEHFPQLELPEKKPKWFGKAVKNLNMTKNELLMGK